MQRSNRHPLSLSRRACALIAAAALLNAGCYVRLGYRDVPLRTDEERKIVSAAGPVIGEVTEGPGPMATLQLLREATEEVRTVEVFQVVQRRFDLTGLAVAAAIGGSLLFILMIILIASGDGGGGGGGGDWDWD